MVNEWVVCPFCFWATKLHQKKGIKEFGKFDLKNNKFIQFRIIKGGQGVGGFWTDEAKSLTIAQAKRVPEYRKSLDQLYLQSLKFIKLYKKK